MWLGVRGGGGGGKGLRDTGGCTAGGEEGQSKGRQGRERLVGRGGSREGGLGGSGGAREVLVGALLIVALAMQVIGTQDALRVPSAPGRCCPACAWMGSSRET